MDDISNQVGFALKTVMWNIKTSQQPLSIREIEKLMTQERKYLKTQKYKQEFNLKMKQALKEYAKYLFA